jgi:hypothetical protein
MARGSDQFRARVMAIVSISFMVMFKGKVGLG